jgi:hypothetical protein
MRSSPSILPSEAVSAAEAEAALVLGRLDGALRYLPVTASRILAARLLQDALAGALRQEGHSFTNARFSAWFAGLTTLTDPGDRPASPLRPARPLVIALLTALGHSSWPALAAVATRMRPALLAFEDGDGASAHGDAQALIAEARLLIDPLAPRPSPLPFAMLAQLHEAVANNVTFAQGGREHVPIKLGDWQVVLERAPAPSPRWAIELLYGEHLHAAGLLSLALPLIGLIRLDALAAHDDAQDDDEARIIRASALRDLSLQLCNHLDETRALVGQLETVMTDRRSTSRVPLVFEHLAGFGALRSSQLATILGATRLGVSNMLTRLDDSGVLERSAVAGVHLYAIRPAPKPEHTPHQTVAPLLFSSAAVVEYNASMANIDEVLARLGVEIDEGDEGDPI